MQKENKFVSHWIPVILVFSILVILTVQPVPTFFYKIYYRADKLVHFCIYLILGFFLVRAFGTVFPGFNVALVAVPALFSSAFLGTLAEALQYFVPARIVDASDIVANLFGSFFGILIYILIRFSLFLLERE